MQCKNTQNKSSKKNRNKNYSKRLEPFGIEAKQKRVIYVLKCSLSVIPEERRTKGGAFKYKMVDFAIAVIIAIIRGCTSHGDSIVEYWKANKSFLHSLNLFTNEETKGDVPSLQSYYRLASMLDSDKFSESLFGFVTDISAKKLLNGLRVLAVDGKTMRGTMCGDLSRPLHILTAFCCALGIPINCVSCSEKSNEITAWQELLELLDEKCKGMVFTSDAMGCQIEIIKTILKEEGNYCLALKGNHRNFEREAMDMISRGINKFGSFSEKETISHGRIEQRICTVYIADPSDENQYITDLSNWPGIKRIIHIKSIRTDKKRGTGPTIEERIYISNLEESPENFNKIIRQHWQVEIFHHSLDTTFQQDTIKRRNDKTNKSSRNLDLFQKAAYIFLRLYDSMLTKLDKDRKTLGIRKMIHKTNASNQVVSDMFNFDIGWITPA